MMVSYYPNLSNKFALGKKIKTSDVEGQLEIADGKVKFSARMLLFIKLKSLDFELDVKDIESVETCNVNGVMPVGVQVNMKNGENYMFGSMKRKKLYQMLEDARVKV